MTAGKLEIDYETAERITLLSLKDHQSYISKELKQHKKGAWMHPEDVEYNKKLLEALNIVVKYFGS